MKPDSSQQNTNKNFYGWKMVWALAISTTVAYGVLYYAFAVFVKSMELELGWNRAQTSGAVSLSFVIGALVSPLLGRLTDRHGARGLMTIGTVIAALLVFAWSRVSSLPMLYVIFAALGMTSSATFYDPAFTAVAVWFKRDRSRALLIITLVAGLASTIFVPLSTFLLERIGWRDAIAVLGAILLATAPMLWLVLRRHPEDVNTTIDGLPEVLETHPRPILAPPSTRDWIRSRSFWSIAIGFALARLAVSTLAPHLVPLLRERGYSSAITATLAGSVGVLQLAGRLLIAPLTRIMSMTVLTAATFFVHGLGLVMLATQTDAGVWAFIALYGSTNGAITIARAALTADQFDNRIYGAVSGGLALVVGLTGALAPFLAGALHERSGDYQSTLWLLIAGLGIGTLVILNARDKTRNPSKLET
jgi:MFS family permease